MIDINDLTLSQLKEIAKFAGCNQSNKSNQSNRSNQTSKDNPYELGQSYFIRTVTMYFTGRLIAVYDQELVFEDCAWIADTGRYSDALKKGTFNEVEPIENINIIGRGALVDCTPISIQLPRVQK